jgi:hypothetical protein
VAKTGRPKAEIDWEKVEELCKIQCTQEEIAAVIGHCVDTIDAHSKELHGMSFSDFFKQKRQGGKCSLRRKQWLMAKHTPSMAIWLGKQYLGQSDKQENLQHSVIQINIDEDDAGV